MKRTHEKETPATEVMVKGETLDSLPGQESAAASPRDAFFFFFLGCFALNSLQCLHAVSRGLFFQSCPVLYSHVMLPTVRLKL